MDNHINIHIYFSVWTFDSSLDMQYIENHACKERGLVLRSYCKWSFLPWEKESLREGRDGVRCDVVAPPRFVNGFSKKKQRRGFRADVIEWLKRSISGWMGLRFRIWRRRKG
jgi:hypothetical protein